MRFFTTNQLAGVLDELLKRLFAIDFLQYTLATSHKDDTGSKWHGASRIEPGAPWRRLGMAHGLMLTIMIR